MIEAHHIAIVTRSIINTHALNNETAEGNEQILRRIQVLAGENNQKDYKYIEVSAISGGMQKFMFDTALRQICKDLKLPISKGATYIVHKGFGELKYIVILLPKQKA